MQPEPSATQQPAASQPETVKEETPAPQPVVEEPVVTPTANIAPPKDNEVQQALSRVFEKLVEIPRELKNEYLSGDFNGDGSQDIAVVVKPAEGSITEINSDLANWTLGDPTIPSQLDPNKPVQPLPPKPEPVRCEQSDLLIAVIHGYGPEGWRNSEARQTYLLRNATGSHLKMQSPKSALATFKDRKALPRLRGDVIAQTVKGESGFLYWNGANYIWHVEHLNLKP
jgi:hypothetical protein